MSELTIGVLKEALRNVPDDYVLYRDGGIQRIPYQHSALNTDPVNYICGVRVYPDSSRAGIVALEPPRYPLLDTARWDSVDRLITIRIMDLSAVYWPLIIAARLRKDNEQEIKLTARFREAVLGAIHEYCSVQPDWKQAMDLLAMRESI